jgi:uncharacterized membrane protein
MAEGAGQGPANSPVELARRLAEAEHRLAEAERRIMALESGAPPAQPFAVIPDEPERSQTPPVPHRSPRDLERVIGANVLAKIGMLVLLLGVVFFLNYAIQQGWITIGMRLGLGVVGGLALAAAGDLLRRRDPGRFNIYGQVLTGGGAAITYFTVFAAYQFEEYRAVTRLTLEADAVLLALLAASLVAYAMLRKTPVLAMEAVALGALAALFGERVTGFSVTYLVILAGGVNAASAWRRWVDVLGASLAASGLSLFLLLVAFDVPPGQALAAAVGLAVVFTLALFFWSPTDRRAGVAGSVVAALSLLAFWAIGVQALGDLTQDDAVWQGGFTAAAALAAGALAALTRQRHHARLGWLVAAIVLALAWPPIQFNDEWTVVAWAGLALAGAAAVFLRDHDLVRASIVAIGGLIVVHLFFQEARRLEAGDLSLALAALPFGLAAAALAAAWAAAVVRGSAENPWHRGVLGLAIVPPLVYASAGLEGFAVSITWAAQGVLLLVLGFTLRIRDLRMAALAVFGLVLARIFLVDITQLDLALRIITFLVVGGLLLAASYLYARRKRDALDEATRAADPVERR